MTNVDKFSKPVFGINRYTLYFKINKENVNLYFYKMFVTIKMGIFIIIMMYLYSCQHLEFLVREIMNDLQKNMGSLKGIPKVL